ncbi:CAP domain-containing protein [Calothrix sp. PCC 7507]|uniref:CAP domain-containing protein n=1 Tax=Calothrix sp. PCC 7507 TaxID=99598 RepID=UPI00029EF8E4|nr:CAP domain-containing protein [Calothrix sp. PCC 7507]AFY35775.1 SCP-like extracellular [Calothrix sp. PCC 7507]
MIRTTIHGIALGTFVLTSGANAISIPDKTSTPKSSHIASHNLLAISYPQSRNYPQRSPYPQARPTNSQRSPYPQTRPTNPQNSPTNPQNSPTNPQNSPTNPQNTPNNSQGSQSSADTASIEASVFQQINQYRASINLPALTRNSAADNQAKIHSQNMASGKVGFGHSGASQRFKATGISYKSAAENVAYNSGSDPATRAVQGWLKSPGHLANIKGNFSLTGIGVAKSSDGKVYLTQLFFLS